MPGLGDTLKTLAHVALPPPGGQGALLTQYSPVHGYCRHIRLWLCIQNSEL